MTTGNLWDANIWSAVLIIALLLSAIIIANSLRQKIRILRESLIPSSVLGGLLLLIASTVCKSITGTYLFDLPMFCAGSAFSGIGILEMITYHCLAIGFICMSLRRVGKTSKDRKTDVFNSGVLTVNTYLIQVLFGLIITVAASFIIPSILKASGILLAFGFGQGTGQALNYGSIYENQFGFFGGKSFGLTIAAMGFLTASLVGVLYLNILKKKGRLKVDPSKTAHKNTLADFEDENEFPLTESVDKLTVEFSIIILIYAASYGIMCLLGKLVGDGLIGTIFGFNFLIGTFVAILFKAVYVRLRNRNIIKREYINNFMMNRIGGFAFDVMILAGIGAIQIDILRDYWIVLLALGVTGAVITFVYVRYVCNSLFKSYAAEQFMAFFGMLTGTASTGVILLREADPAFETPAADNLVYQNLVAIIFGFPIMFLASYAPRSDASTYITFGIVLALFIIFNLILFRSRIFKKKK